jgi:hypothetical protein
MNNINVDSLKNWDNWNKYTDNDGEILHGKIAFFVKDGSSLVAVFDSEGTALPNPIFTDESGRTAEQVFISSPEVLIRYFKYIGDTDMTVDAEENFVLQYTTDWSNKININIESDGLIAVNNIASLRSLDVASVPLLNGISIISLLGYNVPGDKEMINYYWDSTSTLADNGGSVIATSELTGRWIMIPPSLVCDSRHFGIFPNAAYNNIDSQSVQSYRLVTYCNTTGLSPLFQGTDERKYFYIENVTLNSINPIYVTYSTRFKCGANVIIRGDILGSKTTLFISSDVANPVTVYCTEGYSAYGADGVIIVASHIMHLNSNPIAYKTFANLRVYIESEDVVGCTFDNCEIISNKIKLSNTFVKCHLIEANFTQDAAIADMVVTDCTIPLSSWPTINKWLLLRNQIADSNYGDLQGRTLNSSSVISGHNYLSISNAVLDDVDLSSVVAKLKLVNCSGTLTTYSQVILEIIDSDITSDISCTDSTITNSTCANVTSWVSTVKDSTITELIANMSNCKDSTIETIRTYRPILTSCSIGNLYQHMTTDMIIKITNCIFTGNHIFDNPDHVGDGECKITVGVWTNNTTLANDLIDWNGMKSKFDANDQQHTYTYENNSSKNPKIYSYYLSQYSEENGGSPDKVAAKYWYSNGPTLMLCESSVEVQGIDVWTGSNCYISKDCIFKLPIFAVGTYNIPTKSIQISCIQNFTSADEASYVGDFKYDQYVTSNGEPRTIEAYDTATSSAVSAEVTDIAWDNSSQSYYFVPAYNMGTYEDLWIRKCPGPYVEHGVSVGMKQARYKVEEI